MFRVSRKNGQHPPPINWTAIELQVNALRSSRIPPEVKLEQAKRLAAIYQKAGKPLPDILAILT